MPKKQAKWDAAAVEATVGSTARAAGAVPRAAIDDLIKGDKLHRRWCIKVDEVARRKETTPEQVLRVAEPVLRDVRLVLRAGGFMRVFVAVFLRSLNAHNELAARTQGDEKDRHVHAIFRYGTTS